MTNSITIYIDSVGSVLLQHSTRAKRTIITIKPNKGNRVAVPSRVSFNSAIEFVNKNKPWIRKTLARLQQMESQQKDLNELYSNIDKAKAEKWLRLAALQGNQNAKRLLEKLF